MAGHDPLAEGMAGAVNLMYNKFGETTREIKSKIAEMRRYDNDVAKAKAAGNGLRFVRMEFESHEDAIYRKFNHEVKLSQTHYSNGLFDTNLRSLATLFIVNNCAEEIVQYAAKGESLPSERIYEIRNKLERDILSHLNVRKMTLADAGKVIYGTTIITKNELENEVIDSQDSFLTMFAAGDADKASDFMYDLIQKYKAGQNPLANYTSSIEKPFGAKR